MAATPTTRQAPGTVIEVHTPPLDGGFLLSKTINPTHIRMKPTVFLPAIACSLFTSITASAGNLIEVAKSDNGQLKYLLNPDTITQGKNKKGDEFTSAVFEVQNKNKISIERKYVIHHECARGYGALVSLTTDGAFEFENNYLLGGDSIATAIAELLCSLTKPKESNLSVDPKSDERTMAEKKWQETIDDFIATEAQRPGGIDYKKDGKKMQLLDTYVKKLANAPENSNKTMLWFLMEADRLVRLKFTY